MSINEQAEAYETALDALSTTFMKFQRVAGDPDRPMDERVEANEVALQIFAKQVEVEEIANEMFRGDYYC